MGGCFASWGRGSSGSAPKSERRGGSEGGGRVGEGAERSGISKEGAVQLGLSARRRRRRTGGRVMRERWTESRWTAAVRLPRFPCLAGAANADAVKPVEWRVNGAGSQPTRARFRSYRSSPYLATLQSTSRESTAALSLAIQLVGTTFIGDQVERGANARLNAAAARAGLLQIAVIYQWNV